MTLVGLLAALTTAGFGSVTGAGSTEELLGTPQVVLCDLSLKPGCRQGPDAIAWLVDTGVAVVAFSVAAPASIQLTALVAGARGFVHKSAEAGHIAAAVDAVAAGGYWIEPALAGWLLQDQQDDPAAAPGRGHRLTVLRGLAEGDRLVDVDRSQGWRSGTAQQFLAEVVVAFRLRDRKRRPSPRELDVIDCVGRRQLSDLEVARELGISVRTVRAHLQSVKEKYLVLHPSANVRLTPRAVAALWVDELPPP